MASMLRAPHRRPLTVDCCRERPPTPAHTGDTYGQTQPTHHSRRRRSRYTYGQIDGRTDEQVDRDSARVTRTRRRHSDEEGKRGRHGVSDSHSGSHSRGGWLSVLSKGGQRAPAARWRSQLVHWLPHTPHHQSLSNEGPWMGTTRYACTVCCLSCS